MHIRDPRTLLINPVTEFTQQLGKVEEGALYVQKFKGCWRGFFSNREWWS